MNRAQAGPIVAARSRHQVGVCMRKWTLSGGRCAVSVRRWPGRAAMRGDERVGVEELDLQAGGAHPEALPDQAMRRGVVGAGEDDMTVGVKLGLLPLGELPGRQRQGEQGRALEPIEDLERDLLDGAVDAPAGDLEAPAEQMAIAVVEVP